MLSILTESGFPWTEILSGIGLLIVTLLGVANSKLKKIFAETKSNGGKSLKDSVNRVESLVINLASLVEAFHQLSDKPMFRADEEGNFTWMNSAFMQLTGRNSEELKNKGWISSIYEDDRERVSREWESAVEDQRTFYSEFKVINSYTEEEKNVRAKAFPLVNTAFLGYLGTWIVIEEVTE